jgi:hypothetical protein
MDVQAAVLDWAFRQPGATSLMLLVGGLLYSLQGFRFLRLLIPLACGAGGYVLGLIGATIAGLPAQPVGLVAGAAAALLSVTSLVLGLQLAGALVLAMFGQYLAERFELRGVGMLAAVGFMAVAGVALRWVCFHQMPIIVTTLLGAMLLTVAFVAATAQVVPALTMTFVQWCNTMALVGPTFLLMLIVLGYSVQTAAQQGDIVSGGARANFIEGS